MDSMTRFMQNALRVLHNAVCLPSLRNANHLMLMESNQVDGILPQPWLWNICDSSLLQFTKVKNSKRKILVVNRGRVKK